jgi:hypothetical protein
MASTYGQFATLLLNTLGAPEDTTYSDQLLYEATALAMDAILPWIPNQKVTTLTSGSTAVIALPVDCYEVEAVVDDYDGSVLERITLTPKARRPLTSQTSTKQTAYDWLEYPRGYLNFTMVPTKPSSGVDDEGVPLTTTRTFVVYYKAYWSKPSSSADVNFTLPVPDAVIAGMLYWAAAHCIIPSSNISSQIRQFGTKVDSGTPVDNVLENSAMFLRKMFVEEMNRLPKHRGHGV